MAFSCQTSSGSDLCFNGGVCVVVNGTFNDLACSCPPGWTHDNIFFHSPNCTRPESLYLWLLVTFSILAVIFLSHAVYVMRLVKLKGTRRLVGLQAVTIVFHWAISLSLFSEQGYYEGTIVVQGFSLLWSIYQMHSTMVAVVLTPLLMALNASEAIKRRAYRLHVMAPIINSLSFVALFGILLAFCRDPVPTRFNVTICIFLFVFVLTSLAHYVVSRPTASALYQLLDIAGEQNTKILRFRQKAEKSRREWNRMLILITVGQVPIGIVVLCLGSFPYFWIYQSIYLVQIFPISYIVVKFFAQKMKDPGYGTSTTAGIMASDRVS